MHIFFVPSEIQNNSLVETTLQTLCIKEKHTLIIATNKTSLSPEIKNTDALIFEASTPSFLQGKCLTLALQYHKPLLILYSEQNKPNILQEQHQLITSIAYNQDNQKKLFEEVLSFIKIVKKQRLIYRFNLMISKDLNSYLMDKSRSNGVSKADYIRQLIVQDRETSS